MKTILRNVHPPSFAINTHCMSPRIQVQSSTTSYLHSEPLLNTVPYYNVNHATDLGYYLSGLVLPSFPLPCQILSYCQPALLHILANGVAPEAMMPQLRTVSVMLCFGTRGRLSFSVKRIASVLAIWLSCACAGVFGFVSFAEKMNSRACMIGFFALLALEGVCGKGLFELIGLTVGKGLGFEF